MAVCVFPLLLMTIRDAHMDRKYAEKDIRLRFYGRLVYIITQVSCFLHNDIAISVHEIPLTLR